MDDSMNFFFLPLNARTRSMRVKLSSAARYRRIVRKRKKDSYRVLLFSIFFFVVVERCPRMIGARTAISSRWVVDPAVTSSRAVERNLAESRQSFFFSIASPRFNGSWGESDPSSPNFDIRPAVPYDTSKRSNSSPPPGRSEFPFGCSLFVCLVSFRSIDPSIREVACNRNPAGESKKRIDRKLRNVWSFFLSPPPWSNHRSLRGRGGHPLRCDHRSGMHHRRGCSEKKTVELRRGKLGPDPEKHR